MAEWKEELQCLQEQLRESEKQIEQLNQELEETNRGVLALYAELDERAADLRRASEMKSWFLSHMSHEFRTPLNGILGLSRLLLDRIDGELTQEQEKQVLFIRQSAESLSELVNDFLDLAKVEAGKIAVRPEHFKIEDLFGALRGLMRPIIGENSNVELIFDDTNSLPVLFTDEGKVSQILRNFISNAIKFTPGGEVHVSAEIEGRHVIFCVSDTGIGIAKENHELIFEEFAQVANTNQKAIRGTGLGLPLSRKLAELLGGYARVESEPGQGSRFYAAIACAYHGVGEVEIAPANKTLGTNQHSVLAKILIIDDEPIHRYLLRTLVPRHFQVIEAENGEEGLQKARQENPALIFLDLTMPRMGGEEVLAELKLDKAICDTPVIINTSQQLESGHHERLSQQVADILSKEEMGTDGAAERVRAAMVRAGL